MAQYEITYETLNGEHFRMTVESENIAKAATDAAGWLAAHSREFYCITEIKEHIYD